MRIALACAGLFLVTGGVLIAITYALLDHNLPVKAATSTIDPNRAAKLAQACERTTGQPAEQCDQAFAAGEQSATDQQREQTLNGLLFYALTSLAGLTMVAAVLGWLLSGRVLRPLRAVTAAARRASERNLSERLELRGPADELKELADTFDGMLDRLDAAFDSQRRFVANASHELRTPLTVMRTAVDVTLAKSNRTPGQYEAMAVEVRQAVANAEALIDALLTLARSDRGPGRGECVDLATAAEDAVDAAAAAMRATGIELRTQFAPAQTYGDRTLLERMVANLVDNATRHNVPGGWIAVSTERDGSGARLAVVNSGPVIPADLVPALFEPFRRLHERIDSEHGIGMGLPIVRSVVHSHGGVITAEALPTGGLACQVMLPGAGESGLGG